MRALFKIIFSCINNMFSANTIMGRFCHLCLGHDYTITFPVCQGTCHHDRWGLFLALLFELTGGFDEAALKSDYPNRFWGSNCIKLGRDDLD